MAAPKDTPLHPKALEGLHLMNRGEYFEAHEALEAAWRDEPAEIRTLYQGILQAAVVYLHILRRNYPGVIKVYKRSQKWLMRWEGVVRGVDVDTLRQDLDTAVAEVRRLGPERLAEFDQGLLKPVSYHEA
jgi:predicted metal-dependent hydrolase